MAVTPNLNLYKPSREDYISVTRDISENMDKIDTGYGNLQNSISGVDDTIGIVVNGNTSLKNITAGQFVIVKNSTISGVTDGLYTAVNNVASETALVAADLSSSNTGDGGLNALNSNLMYAFVQAVSATNTSNTITIPKKGVYLISLLAQKGSVAGGTHSITQNGYFSAGCETHQNEQYVSMTIPLSCNQGDIIGFTTTVPFVSTANKHSCQLAVAFMTYA